MGSCASVSTEQPQPPVVRTPLPTVGAPADAQEAAIQNIIIGRTLTKARYACNRLFCTDEPPPALIPHLSARGWIWTWRRAFGTTEIEILTMHGGRCTRADGRVQPCPGLCIISAGLVGTHRVTRASGHIPLMQPMLAESCRHPEHSMHVGAHGACGSCLMRACAPIVWSEVALYNGVAHESERQRIARHARLRARRSADQRAEAAAPSRTRSRPLGVFVSCDE
jgi:hypothetical protein